MINFLYSFNTLKCVGFNFEHLCKSYLGHLTLAKKVILKKPKKKSNNLEAVKYLLSIGSNIDVTSAKGGPASHVACLIGSTIEIVEYLLSFSSDLYKVDEDGWNVLHCASNQGNWL